MPTGSPALLGRCAAFRMALAGPALLTAFSCGLVVFFLAAARSALLAAARYLVDGRPGPALSFFVGYAAFLVTLFDVLSLALLLVGVAALVSSWHRELSLVLRSVGVKMSSVAHDVPCPNSHARTRAPHAMPLTGRPRVGVGCRGFDLRPARR